MQPDSEAFYNNFNWLKQSLEQKFGQGMIDKSYLVEIYPSMEAKTFSGALPLELPLWLCHETLLELTVLWDPHLHFTTLGNSIFVQNKQSI